MSSGTEAPIYTMELRPLMKCGVGTLLAGFKYFFYNLRGEMYGFVDLVTFGNFSSFIGSVTFFFVAAFNFFSI